MINRAPVSMSAVLSAISLPGKLP